MTPNEHIDASVLGPAAGGTMHVWTAEWDKPRQILHKVLIGILHCAGINQET
jgi:hypothetical protein